MDMEKALSMVLDTLQCACSQNQENFKPAEKKLQEWEIEPGFYSILLNIFSNHAVDVNVRWLAVLYFKNGAEKYWRSSAPNAISEEEKAKLRQGLVTNFREPVGPLATQLAVVIAKVARMDCPKDWPDLVPTLLTAVRDADLLVQHRALLTLHHVVKTLSSKRLPGDRRLFQELTGNVYSFALTLWNTHTELFLQQFSENTAAAAPSLEKALLALRILRKLTVHGFLKPNESEDVVIFINMVFDRAKTMLELRKQLPSKNGLRDLIEKFIINLTKVLNSVLEMHPYSFIDFIQRTLEFTVFYTFMSGNQEWLFERFKIQCLNLIKLIMLCVEYKPGVRVKDPQTLRAHQIKTSFFTPEVLTAICQGLVGHYFLLTQEDLQMWDEDPETFATDESGECWKYSLRPCTEWLFVTVFREFSDILAPVLSAMIQANHGLVSGDDLNGILVKDAIYYAVGLAAFELYDEINFDEWFLTTLRQELQLQGGHYRVLRRRVAWLLGQWTGVRFSAELRPVLYSAILSLLQPSEDLVVRLTVSRALKSAMDDFEFSTDQFLEYLEPVIGLLFNLLKECKECDSKMHVLYVMSFVVERVGHPIRPHVSNLIQYLPLAWEESSEHSMLRCAIVSTLVQIVKAMAHESKVLHNFLMPVLALCTDMQQDSNVYFIEDGLALWLACVENATEMTDELMQLFQNMPPLIESSTENLRICLEITQAYVVLSPECFLKVYGDTMLKSCLYMLTDLRPEGINIILKHFELSLRAAPLLSCEMLRPFIPQVLIEVSSTVQCKHQDISMSTFALYYCIIARILLSSKDTFSQMMRDAAHQSGQTEDQLFANLLKSWLMWAPFVSNLKRKKILGLALSSLLSVQSRIVLDVFNGIIQTVVEALNDITKPDGTGAPVDIMCCSLSVPSSETEDFFDHETEHDQRLKRLATQDIVHTINLRDYLLSQLNELKTQIGQEQLQQFLKSLDAETASMLEEYMNFSGRDSHIESHFTDLRIS
ncbi:Importin-11 [Frankliniella fusca]|uniref:Importin-11 n=1 Tax=Frankliniella fusca TaxID=407009 RepID=A0AAE1LAM2_9NEOP|nr:Importin-11 [Frankliniella fusca]